LVTNPDFVINPDTGVFEAAWVKTGEGMRLISFQSIVEWNEDEIYLQFRLENQESIDFDLNFLKFSIATSYKKSSSNQKTEILPAFRYKVPKEVKGNTENHFVVVFKKFSLDRNKVLVVDLAEENGNRNLSLEIDHNLINNPFKI